MKKFFASLLVFFMLLVPVSMVQADSACNQILDTMYANDVGFVLAEYDVAYIFIDSSVWVQFDVEHKKLLGKCVSERYERDKVVFMRLRTNPENIKKTDILGVYEPVYTDFR